MMRREPLYIPPLEQDGTSVRMEKSADQVKYRCLSCPVRPDDGDPLSGLDLEAYIREGLQALETFRKVFDHERLHVSPSNPFHLSFSAPITPLEAKRMIRI